MPKTWYLYGPLPDGRTIHYEFISGKTGSYLYDVRTNGGVLIGTVKHFGKGWSMRGNTREIGYHRRRIDAVNEMMKQKYGALRHG